MYATECTYKRMAAVNMQCWVTQLYDKICYAQLSNRKSSTAFRSPYKGTFLHTPQC